MSRKIKTVFIASKKTIKKGLFGKEKATDMVDGDLLSESLELACENLVESGYSILNITSVISGDNNYKSGSGFGYGYSFTSGILITAQRALS